MRILIVCHGFPPSALGGSEIYAETQARELRDRFGDEVFVLTREANPTADEYRVRYESRDGLEIAWINNTFRATRSFEESYCHETIGLIAERIIDRFRPDVAHIHHLTCLSTTIVRSLADRRIPAFYTLHDYWLLCHRGQMFDRQFRACDRPADAPCSACVDPVAAVPALGASTTATVRAIERRLPLALAHGLRAAAGRLSSPAAAVDDPARRRADHMRRVIDDVSLFLAPSAFIRHEFIQCGVPANRIIHHRYGFEHRGYVRRPRRGARPLRLGFIGSLIVAKAPHLLIEAGRLLPSLSVSVDIFGAFAPYHGDDSYRKTLEPLLAPRDVRVHGPIPHVNVPNALAALDVLVVPSTWPENSPLVIHEAFLAGIPVIASRIGGIPEVVSDGRNGLLFEPGNASDLARVIKRLLDDPALYYRLCAGIPVVRSIRDDVATTRSMYEQRLWRRGRPPRQQNRLAAVVLNYRTPDDTLLAVRSLLASTHRPSDLIVVDNGPGAGAGDTLKEVAERISYLPTGVNRGFAGGMNVGIREALARGADHILLVNSDVIVRPDCIARLLDELARHPRAGIAGPLVLNRSTPWTVASFGISYSSSTGRMWHASGSIDDRRRSASPVDAISGCVMLVSRDVFERVGLFDEDYFFSFEDLDFCLRARCAGFETILAASAVAYHEGSRAIGAQSPARLYFAARNHLLLASRADATNATMPALMRMGTIVALNAAHAIRSHGGSLPARLAAVARGTRDYMTGRFGAGSESSSLSES
jgi:GT2 family glycosyltransferase/glycosyltransferase involved in cell wall biosynthesis